MTDTGSIDMGWSIPFAALGLEAFATPEKESTGPMNHLHVEMPAGVCGAANGYAMASLPLTRHRIEDAEQLERYPADALTQDWSPEAFSVPFELLQRAEHAALAMRYPPSSAFVVALGKKFGTLALMVREIGPKDTEPATAVLEIPTDTPRGMPYLKSAMLGEMEMPLTLGAKFFQKLGALSKKAGCDTVFIGGSGMVGEPIIIRGTANTGQRFRAAIMPDVMAERASTEMRAEPEVDPETGEIIDVQWYTADERAGAEHRTDRAMPSGLVGIGAGESTTDPFVVTEDDDDDRDEA